MFERKSPYQCEHSTTDPQNHHKPNIYHPRQRCDDVFTPCVCVCVCLSMFVTMFVRRFNYEGLVPHKQYFVGTLLVMYNWASYVSRSHDAIDDVTRSQSRSNFEIHISLSIFELERRLKSSKCRKCLWLSFWYIQLPVKEFVARSKWQSFWKFWKIKQSFNLTSDMKRSSQIMPEKYFSWWWRQRWRHRVPSKSALYILL